jgi:MFS family permease
MHEPHHHNYLFNKELSEIYISIAIRRFAFTMIGIFIPLYLYIEMGLALQTVILFYLVQNLVFFFVVFLSAKIGEKVGEKHLVLYSIPFLVLAFVFLIFMKQFDAPFWLPAIMMGLSCSFYWIGIHIEFASASDRKHRGREVALWHVISIVVGIIGPILGALILTFYNFTVLLVVVSVLFFISALPLFFSKEIRVGYSLSWKKVIDKEHFRYAASYFSQSIRDTAVMIFWPILVFIVLGGFLSLGIMASVTSIGVAIFTLYVGKFIDKDSKTKIIHMNALFEGIVLFFRGMVKTVTQIFALDFLGGLFNTGVTIPLLTKTYNRAKKGDIVAFILFRETVLRLGRFFLLGFAFVMLYYFPEVTTAIRYVFTLSAFASLLHLIF